jgi:hypothetical protein
VIAAVIRDAKGQILVRRARPATFLTPATELEERDAVTANGEEVRLFRAPVTGSGGGDMAAEPRSHRGQPPRRKNGVEVAI